MRRQRNMVQMKEQNKTPEKEQNETEIANLSDAEFKTLVIRIPPPHGAELRRAGATGTWEDRPKQSLLGGDAG